MSKLQLEIKEENDLLVKWVTTFLSLLLVTLIVTEPRNNFNVLFFILLVIILKNLFKNGISFIITEEGIQVDTILYTYQEIYKIDFGIVTSGYRRPPHEFISFKALKDGRIYEFKIVNSKQKYISQLDLPIYQPLKTKLLSIEQKTFAEVTNYKRSSLEFILLSIYSSSVILILFSSMILALKYNSYHSQEFDFPLILLITGVFFVCTLYVLLYLVYPIEFFAKEKQMNQYVIRLLVSLVIAVVLFIGSREIIYSINYSKVNRTVTSEFIIQDFNVIKVPAGKYGHVEVVEVAANSDNKIFTDQVKYRFPLECLKEIGKGKKFQDVRYWGKLNIAFMRDDDSKKMCEFYN